MIVEREVYGGLELRVEPEIPPAWDFRLVRQVLLGVDVDEPGLWERIHGDPEAAFIGLADVGRVGFAQRGRLQLRRFTRGSAGAVIVDYFEEFIPGPIRPRLDVFSDYEFGQLEPGARPG